MLAERIKQMVEQHVPKYFAGDEFIKPIYLCVLRSRLYTESWKETEGQPTSIRRAKAFARYMDNIPVFIRPFELIVGYCAGDPHVMPITIESVDPKVIENYIDAGLCRAEEVDEIVSIVDKVIGEVEKELAIA